MTKGKAYLNGKIVPLEQAVIPVSDRGFLYGDGVFESLRTYHTKPFQLEEHIKRLLRGAKLLRLRALPSAAQLKLAILKTLAANKYKESYIKVIITRGATKGHGLSPKQAVGKPSIIILVEPQKPYPNKIFTLGWKAIISSIVRPDVPASKIKSLNYVNNVLAKAEASRAGADEAIMFDEKGNVAEGTISNIFVVKHGILNTPPKEAPILAGLTRDLVIKLAKQSAFPVVEKVITPKELYTADECFVTFSGAGVVPLTRVWKKKIGSGKPGYVTTSLIKLYNDETKKI
ncbi:MAG: aminotransferase class IV [Candidatus Margulisbacteria bacterium]|nr:aminotransferase class IV [Candidatus Margulisiibacteriota bacterium]